MGIATHCAGCNVGITDDTRQHANSWLCRVCFRTSRRCSRCKTVLDLDLFEKKGSRCPQCVKELNRPGDKTCSTCGTKRPAIEFHRNSKDCPDCYGKRRRCTQCKEVLDLDQFHKTASGQGLRRVCKGCVAAKRKDEYHSRERQCIVCGTTHKSFVLNCQVCSKCHGKHRRCGSCNTVKTVDQFYRDTRRTSGRQSHCKMCVSLRQSQSRRKSSRICQGCKEDLTITLFDNPTDKICTSCRTATTQSCSVCGKTKEISEFSTNNDSRSARGIEKRCKQCIREKQRSSSKSPRGRYRSANHAAKRGSYDFDIALDSYLNLISEPCHYCGHPLNETGSGLDRIDPEGGYTLDNVVPCCRPCNWTKSDFFTYEEMTLIGKSIGRVKSSRADHQAALQQVT